MGVTSASATLSVGSSGPTKVNAKPDTDKLVTVASFPHPIQAWIARNRLADEGIPAFVQDDNVVAMNWLYAFAVHGVKVQVPGTDAVIATAILAKPNEAVVGSAPDEPESDGTLTCKQCGSHNVCAETFSKRAVFLCWLILGFPIPILGKESRCFSCGYYDRPASWLDKGLPRQFSLRSLFILTLIVACVLGVLRALGLTSISTTGSNKTATQEGY